jgi:hypothetical protein
MLCLFTVSIVRISSSINCFAALQITELQKGLGLGKITAVFFMWMSVSKKVEIMKLA